MASEKCKQPYYPGIQRVEHQQRLAFARGGVAELSDSLIVDRVPAIPNLQPATQSSDRLVLYNLIALAGEQKQNRLDADDDRQHAPLMRAKLPPGVLPNVCSCSGSSFH